MTIPRPPAAPRKLRLGHSPDADDAFMFYALLSGKVSCEGFVFEQVLEGIEALNRMALRREIDVTAASVHACALMGDDYRILDAGASVGDGYGPIVVSREPMTLDQVGSTMVAIPGILTSAYLAMRLAAGPFEFKVVPFDAVFEEVKEGRAGAGLVIHEGQLTYQNQKLHNVVDLGVWWQEQTGLPLPLGGNAIRRDLGEPLTRTVAEVLEAPIAWALAHREEALGHALAFGRGLDRAKGHRFVGMYVNEATLDYGERGRRGVELFYRRAHEAGLIPGVPRPEFIRG